MLPDLSQQRLFGAHRLDVVRVPRVQGAAWSSLGRLCLERFANEAGELVSLLVGLELGVQTPDNEAKPQDRRAGHRKDQHPV